MEKQFINYSAIESNSPKAWKDFLSFYTSEFASYSFLNKVEFNQLPFEMQLGIFLKYFNENGIELDVCNTDYALLPDTITEAFSNHEKGISHYS
jgi:hypothetical protein